MRKRSSYRPRPQLANPVQWVLGGFQPMRENEHAVGLKIKNHQAMLDMTAGHADRQTVDLLIAAMNMARLAMMAASISGMRWPPSLLGLI